MSPGPEHRQLAALAEALSDLDGATRRRYIEPWELDDEEIRARTRPLGWALALALVFAPWPSRAADDAAQGLKLERVVMLMRHGIRPPTKATVTPPGITAEPWPSWDARMAT